MYSKIASNGRSERDADCGGVIDLPHDYLGNEFAHPAEPYVTFENPSSPFLAPAEYNSSAAACGSPWTAQITLQTGIEA